MSLLRHLTLAYIQQRRLAQSPRPFGIAQGRLLPGVVALGALRHWGEDPVTGAKAGGRRRNAGVRGSDADREQVVSFLKRHCAEGRLSTEELSARVEAAYRTVVLAELEPLTSDLPGSPWAPPIPPAAPSRRRRPLARVALLGSSALLLVALASLVPAELWAPLMALVFPFALFALFSILPFALPVLAMLFMIRSLSGPSGWRLSSDDDRARQLDERGWRAY